jgi:hypothetical protein
MLERKRARDLVERTQRAKLENEKINRAKEPSPRPSAGAPGEGVRGSILRRPRRVGPVTRRIAAADDHSLLVPIEAGPHVGGTIAQSQAAPAPVRIVGFGTVKKQIVMDRDFARLELYVDRLAKLFGVFDRLVERVVLILQVRWP